MGCVSDFGGPEIRDSMVLYYCSLIQTHVTTQALF